MPLSSHQRRNFETLRRAFLAEDAALMECQLAATGEPVAVICAANRLAEGAIEFVPLYDPGDYPESLVGLAPQRSGADLHRSCRMPRRRRVDTGPDRPCGTTSENSR